MREWILDLPGVLWETIARDARVLLRGKITPFPFQANLYGHAPDVIRRCLTDFAAERIRETVNGPVEARNFEEWLLRRFGRAMCREFFFPYNRKMWCTSLRGMGYGWTSWSVPVPAIADLLAGARGETQDGDGVQPVLPLSPFRRHRRSCLRPFDGGPRPGAHLDPDFAARPAEEGGLVRGRGGVPLRRGHFDDSIAGDGPLLREPPIRRSGGRLGPAVGEGPLRKPGCSRPRGDARALGLRPRAGVPVLPGRFSLERFRRRGAERVRVRVRGDELPLGGARKCPGGGPEGDRGPAEDGSPPARPEARDRGARPSRPRVRRVRSCPGCGGTAGAGASSRKGSLHRGPVRRLGLLRDGGVDGGRDPRRPGCHPQGTGSCPRERGGESRRNGPRPRGPRHHDARVGRRPGEHLVQRGTPRSRAVRPRSGRRERRDARRAGAPDPRSAGRPAGGSRPRGSSRSATRRRSLRCDRSSGRRSAWPAEIPWSCTPTAPRRGSSEGRRRARRERTPSFTPFTGSGSTMANRSRRMPSTSGWRGWRPAGRTRSSRCRRRTSGRACRRGSSAAIGAA